MNIKDLLYSCSILSDYLFFSVLGIFGASFGGSEESPIYKLYMAAFGGYIIVNTLLEILQGNLFYTKTFWCLMVGLPLFVMATYYYQTGVYVLDVPQMNIFLLFMACFPYPGICSGIYMAYKGIHHFVKYLDIVVYVMTLSVGMSISGAIAGIIDVGGASYQTMSYTAGFSFCYTLCMIFWGEKYEHYTLFKGDRWKNISYFLLIVQLLACLISGGRGGFVVLAVGASYIIFRSKRFGRIFTLGSFAVLITMAAGSFVDTPISDALERSTSRTFNYLNTEDGTSVKRVTGRETIYEHAIDVIQEDHYMGRGLFRSLAEGTPHNFFLEIGEHGGIPYILFWVFMLFYIFKKVHYLINTEDAYVLLPFIFFIYIYLMFSNSYLFVTVFWFILSYTLTRIELEKTIS